MNYLGLKLMIIVIFLMVQKQSYLLMMKNLLQIWREKYLKGLAIELFKAKTEFYVYLCCRIFLLHVFSCKISPQIWEGHDFLSEKDGFRSGTI